jgi:hypothetical protein
MGGLLTDAQAFIKRTGSDAQVKRVLDLLAELDTFGHKTAIA